MQDLHPIAVVTDSAAGIPKTLLEKYRIAVAPLAVLMDNESFLDGINIDPPTFFRRLRAQQEPQVKTSIPSPAVFQKIYRQLAEWAQGIVSVHVAGEQSGTCGSARLAAEDSPVPVVVVDSETTAMAQGFVTLEAARAALQGATLHEVVERARAVIPNVEVTALLETINYAVQGGRLASAARLLGNLLRIQPLVRVAENKVGLIGQTRRRRKGLRQLLESIQARVGESPVHIAVHHAGDEAEGRALLEQLQASLDCVEAYLTWVPVALGVHAGPGAVGVACYVEGQGLRKGPGWGPNIRSQE